MSYLQSYIPDHMSPSANAILLMNRETDARYGGVCCSFDLGVVGLFLSFFVWFGFVWGFFVLLWVIGLRVLFVWGGILFLWVFFSLEVWVFSFVWVFLNVVHVVLILFSQMHC